MKKRNWVPIKSMLFTYLAVSKMIYWINLVTAVDGIENVWPAILERFMQQDLVLIVFIALTYFFDKEVKKRNGFLKHIIYVVGNYLLFGVILITFMLITNQITPTLAILIEILLSPFMLNWSVMFFVVMGALELKELLKKKEAAEYALNIQSADIKHEMLQTLLEDGALTHEEFEKQKAKLLIL